jgi:hypothetical protein
VGQALSEAARVIAVSGRRLTATESNWLWGVGLTVAGVSLFTLVGTAEEALLAAPRRAQLVWSPWETLTRFLAIAHTIVATLFLLTSRRVRSAAGAAWVAALAVAGILLCLGFSALGGLGAALGVTAFFAYFLLHEVRDELFFYRVNGDAPRVHDGGGPASLWPWAGLLVAGILVTFAVGILAGARARRVQITGAVLPAHALIAVVMLAAGVALAVVVLRRLCAEGRGGWRDALVRHRPLVVVLAGLYLVLVGGFALTGRAYAVVAVHVMVWFVFALRRMPAHGPRPPRFTWRWARGTRAGFTALHAGVFGVVVAAAGLWAFALGNAAEPAIFGVILSRESFPYWTIMHVTLSWVPRVDSGS